ncbi:UNKNOWN [Stylonychia lemnae]|uniref:Uncharacterized protein n=1 Tax=Stylonychia lemnae TaxID=5949 RepID=A0A078B7G7_STYLE|nr:UNKNOWN [Stylonychia lemnae]|eukprot:CDW89247.1 UNKNOWN [Stylonychia lemnae]
MASSLVNVASYNLRGVRQPPNEQGTNDYQSVQNQAKGKLSGFYTSRPSIYGEQILAKTQSIEVPIKDVKYKDTMFQGTAQHLLASSPSLIINKEYEKPRYGDASIQFKHPTYLPNHPNKKTEITLEHQEMQRVPLSTRRRGILMQDNVDLKQEFLKSVDFETTKGFKTLNLETDRYKDELDHLHSSIDSLFYNIQYQESLLIQQNYNSFIVLSSGKKLQDKIPNYITRVLLSLGE